MHKSVPIKLVKPNPFRHMDRYPIDEGKINELMGSMARTGFWDNVVARNGGEFYELAYGHHRWIAFKRKYGEGASINLIVRDLPDADMLRIMADENMQEFGTSAEVEQETVRAVVLAYAEGKIELERPDRNIGGEGRRKGTRYAPYFVPGYFKEDKIADSKPYNAESIARFLGWMSGKQVSPRVRAALEALEGIEEGLLTEADMRGLTSDQAETIAQEAVKIKKSYAAAAGAVKNPERAAALKEKGTEKAREAAKRTAEKVKTEASKPKGERFGVRDIGEEMAKERMDPPRERRVPTAEKFCESVAVKLDEFLGADDRLWSKINEIIKFRADIDPDALLKVEVALNSAIERCANIKKSLTRKEFPRVRN